MTLDTLKASKLGKIVVKLVKEPRSPGEFSALFLFFSSVCLSLVVFRRNFCRELSKLKKRKKEISAFATLAPAITAAFLYTIDAVRHVLQNKTCI